jgi:hypothetical protein
MIIRAPRPDANFYVLDKAISEDRRLSWAARGVLVFLLGKPDNWEVSVAALVNETAECTRPTGRDGVYAALKELIEVGYIVRVQTRADDGAMSSVRYLVGETPRRPLTEKPEAAPLTGLPDTAQPDTANPTLTRTDFKQGLREEQELKDAKPKRAKAAAVIKPAEWIDDQVWADFVQHRKEIKAPLTGKASERLLVTLSKAREAGHNPNDMLNKSIEMGWRGVFIPRGTNPPHFPGVASKADQRNDWLNGGRPDKQHQGAGNVIDVVATTIG